MIQVIFGILLIFIYPFANKIWAGLMVLALWLFTIIVYFLPNDFENFMRFFITNMLIFLVGYVIRAAVLRSKNNDALEDLEAMYKNKKAE